MKKWCKILENEEYGQVLIRAEYNSVEECFNVFMTYHAKLGFMQAKLATEGDSDQEEKWAYDCVKKASFDNIKDFASW